MVAFPPPPPPKKKKTAFLGDFPLCPQDHPPQKPKFYFYCRLAVSDRFSSPKLSGGRGCLGGGRLGVPGQVREFRFLPSFPLFPGEDRSSSNVWENAWKSQTSSFHRARKRHINFEHINFLKVGTALGQPAG